MTKRKRQRENNQTATEKELELQYLYRYKSLKHNNISGIAARLVQSGTKWGGLVAIAYLAYEAIIVLAGQTTRAEFAFLIISELNTDSWVGYLFGVVGTIFGVASERLRRKTIARLSKRIAEFEKEQNPERLSSGLTELGETHGDDKL